MRIVGNGVKIAGWSAVACWALSLLAGCGGGLTPPGTGTVPESTNSDSLPLYGSGSIEPSDDGLVDGRRGDAVQFTVGRGGTVYVTMAGQAPGAVVAPACVVVEGNHPVQEACRIAAEGGELGDVARDGDANTMVFLTARAGATYTAVFTTTTPAEFGQYRYSVVRPVELP